ncbi:hypothetical protein D3C78_786920 [compost metagenome]
MKTIAGLVQPAQKTCIAAVIPTGSQNPRNNGTMQLEVVGVTGIDTRALWLARPKIVDEIFSVEVNAALHHADSKWSRPWR